MNNHFRFKVALQTMKDHLRITIILTVLFMAIAVMYSVVYPAFKDIMKGLGPMMDEQFRFIPGAQDIGTFVGFLNMELYQIFWLLIMAIIIGFIAASLISKELESKTIDLFMSNPISRKQIIFEKYLGLIPTILIINFATMFMVYGATIAINEEIKFENLFLAHVASIPYFLAVISIGILISVLIDEKMRASIIMISILVGMFILRSISLMIPDYKSLGYVSLSHYFNPYDSLKYGKIDEVGIIVLLVVAIQILFISMVIFEHRDITV